MYHVLFLSMYSEAVRVAYDLMLQEDFLHPVTRQLAWYSCHLYWKHLSQLTPEGAEEEEQKVQVDRRVRGGGGGGQTM